MKHHNGFALFATLVAMLVIATLITATALSVSEHRHIAQTNLLHHRALAAAEDALWQTIPTLNAKTLRAALIGMSNTTTISTALLTRTVSVTKLDTAILWITVSATARAGPDSATHRIALWARLPKDTTISHPTPLPSSAWADLY